MRSLRSALLLPLTALSILSLFPDRAPGAQGDLLWERAGRLAAGPAEVRAVSTADTRVVTAGFGTTASGKAWWVRSHDVKTGKVLWEHLLDGGEAVDVKTGHSKVVAAGTVLGPGGNKDILVIAYAAATGAILWSDRIDTGGEDIAASLSRSPDGSSTSVAGTADGALLVRTYVTESGTILWTNFVPGPHAVGAVYIDNWVFVCGSRGDGDSADFMVRVHSVSAGALRKEHVVDTAGEEDRCLSAAGPGGEIWTAGFTTAGGQADFLVKAYTTPSNQAILTDRFDLAGGDDKALAMAYQRNRGAATGFGTSANGDRDIVTRVHDLVHRNLLWEDVQDPSGGGDDEGLAAVVAGGRLFVAGHAGDHPLVIAFGWGSPKVQHWQVISAHPGTARAIAYANGRVFAAGTIRGTDDVPQLWIVAYDAF